MNRTLARGAGIPARHQLARRHTQRRKAIENSRRASSRRSSSSPIRRTPPIHGSSSSLRARNDCKVTLRSRCRGSMPTCARAVTRASATSNWRARLHGWESLANAAMHYRAGAAGADRRSDGRSTVSTFPGWRRRASLRSSTACRRIRSLPSSTISGTSGTCRSSGPTGADCRNTCDAGCTSARTFACLIQGRRTAYSRGRTSRTTGAPCQQDGREARSTTTTTTEPARQGAYRAPERVFDHRAIVYMRHGEPLYQLGGDSTR